MPATAGHPKARQAGPFGAGPRARQGNPSLLNRPARSFLPPPDSSMDVVRPRTGREASNSRNAIRRCRWNPIRFLFRTDRSGPQLGSPLASISHSHSWSRIIGRALALRVARDLGRIPHAGRGDKLNSARRLCCNKPGSASVLYTIRLPGIWIVTCRSAHWRDRPG